VAFDQERAVALADRVASEIDRIQQITLRVQGCLGRVEVLRLLVAERAPAERHDPSLLVPDGEHQAVAEAIVAALAVLTRDDEADGHQRLLADTLAAHEVAESAPLVG